MKKGKDLMTMWHVTVDGHLWERVEYDGNSGGPVNVCTERMRGLVKYRHRADGAPASTCPLCAEDARKEHRDG